MNKHQSREQLLRHLDGELSRFAAWQASAHLKSCWACQVELAHLKEGITEIVDAQSRVFEPSLPPPPGPWPRLEPRLERASISSVPAWKKIGGFSGRSRHMRMAYSGVLLAAAVVALSLWVSVRPVSAKAILTQVTAADTRRLAVAGQQVVQQRVRVQKTSGDASPKLVRMNSWKSATSTYWDSNDQASAELLARYKSYGIESALPLSPVSIETWVKAAGDDPIATRDRDSIKVEVTSNATAGPRGLDRVSLQINAQDWHLEQMTLAFTDTTYQITEEEFSFIAREDVPRDVMARLAPPAEASFAPVAPSLAVDPTDSFVDLDDLEMEVRYGMHRIGVDLGEAIEIVPEPPDRLRVEARQVSPETREKLVALLGDKEGVHLEFEAAGSAPGSAVRRIIPQTGGLRARDASQLAVFFGSAEAREAFAKSALETSSSVLARLYALKELASRWPEDGNFSAKSKATLDEIVGEHVHEIVTETSGLEKQLAPLMEHFGVAMIKSSPGETAVSWRDASNSGLDAARHADYALRSLLTSSGSALPLEQVLSQLRQSLDEIQRAAQQL